MLNVEIKNENKFFFSKKKDVNLCQFFKVITQVIRLKTSYLKKKTMKSNTQPIKWWMVKLNKKVPLYKKI